MQKFSLMKGGGNLMKKLEMLQQGEAFTQFGSVILAVAVVIAMIMVFFDPQLFLFFESTIVTCFGDTLSSHFNRIKAFAFRYLTYERKKQLTEMENCKLKACPCQTI
jgi:hypothetical protein